jgi:uncharacterized membrane protein
MIIATILSDDQYIGIAMTALTAVIGVLWRINVTNTTKIEKRADKIEMKYDENNDKLIEMSKEVGELKGRVTISEEIMPHLKHIKDAFESLADHVKIKIHKE